MPDSLLSIENLSVRFRGDAGIVEAVTDVNLTVKPGETVALVGESGSGKTMTALAITRLLPPGAEVSGRVHFRGEDLLAISEERLRRYRGGKVAYVFQEPATALNPVFTIRYQIEESLRLHRVTGHDVESLLVATGIRDPSRVAQSYPHQLSGGQQQRVMLAMALACDPELLVADEPTTALDVTVQAQILELLQSLRRERGLAMLLITHNLAIAARMADRICVMYAGQQVETGPAVELLARPAHPYTQALLDAVPRLRGDHAELKGIPGQVPSGLNGYGAGCRFRNRCAVARSKCETNSPDLISVSGSRSSRCFFWSEVSNK